MENGTIQIGKVANLIKEVSSLKEQDKKLRKIKGEDFNLFSIMKMETNENNTHSNVIGELLNPSGSHHMGDVFLRLFLKIIYAEQKIIDGKPKNTVDINLLLEKTTPKVFLEYYIGYQDSKLKTGGRIDILIEFGELHTISIENKIHASDQHLQLKRYHNFRKGKNDVFYLSLFGSKASDDSLDDLTMDDIYNISYQDHIKNWIQKSIQISAEQPILRESLKQYLILINKLTDQMEDQLEHQMNELLKNNLQTALSIFNNYPKAKNLIKSEIKNEVFERIQLEIPKYDLQIVHGNDVQQKFSQIWIYTKGIEKPMVRFGIESFSGHWNSWHQGQMMVGILNDGKDKTIAKEINEKCNDPFLWPKVVKLKNSNNNPLNLDNLDTLELFLDPATRQQNIDIIIYATKEMVNKYYEIVNTINKRLSHI